MKNPILALTILTMTLRAAAGGGFLFVTFKGEQSPMTEQIHFALSKDGRQWDAMNGGEPVLISTIGEKGVRDPYLFRSPDGKKFHMVATDLSIHFNPDWKRAVEKGSKSIVIWESDDLVRWSKPQLVKVASDDAGCTWAPEVVYDEDAHDCMVFWASTTQSDKFAKHRIWATRTKDFKSFGKPFIYIDKPTTIIDTTIVRNGGKYFRFTKDEQFKAITMEVSDRLLGPWQIVPQFSLSKLQGFEGPECYQLKTASDGKPATWCLVLDYYSKGKGYQPFVTEDLAGGKFNPGPDFGFPFRFRHGSILPLSDAEYERLEKADAKPGSVR